MTAPDGPAPPAAREDAAAVIELPVRRTRRHRALFASQALQDGPAALTLLAAGLAELRAPSGSVGLALAVAELGVGGVVLGMLVRGARAVLTRSGREPFDVDPWTEAPVPVAAEPERVRWEGVAAGAMALVEVWHHWTVTGRVRRPTLLVGLITLALAVGGARYVQRRFAGRRERLEVSRAGVRYRGGPRRRHRFEARWDDVARVEHTSGALRLVLRDGRAWALHAHEHLDGAALVRAARAAVAAHAPARLGARGGGVGGAGGSVSPP